MDRPLPRRGCAGAGGLDGGPVEGAWQLRRPPGPRAVQRGDARPGAEQRPLRNVCCPRHHLGRAVDGEGCHRAVRLVILCGSSMFHLDFLAYCHHLVFSIPAAAAASDWAVAAVVISSGTQGIRPWRPFWAPCVPSVESRAAGQRCRALINGSLVWHVRRAWIQLQGTSCQRQLVGTQGKSTRAFVEV